ncbi:MULTISPECIES: flagellar hook protein FlgE [Frigoribacterium]|jgi:flagellar hook protein FlgE|uniref:flagellar hook protein FlgE n=1 Tax=Frigoribacterium TaxID=96492 RepID=UPI000700BB33|nr:MULTISPECIES: flagellar hook protein FlgE [Frigoribacterium]KQR44288.1 flagellar hook protein [Frigoribacterium sp. Leaf164]MBD8661170.1 flagellar hook protein FlgE [Frigoribacterium sp. CFBP 8754]MBD8727037.1 flagellar hook protein FlgE [Frigoribacterium sp. CFBP 13707]NII51921.1 flagellar hook protein FlgE [Frigoribacterium endophyticum]QNE43703.1 flagellar hook protein FlgE [Frigoribacterium sp. NBH87]
MLRSLYSGISGLRSHQTMLDVTGNNIANVNTAGFKASTTQFQDTLSQMTQGAGGPQTGIGGTNPAQVGLGVQVAGISTNFAQGSAQATGKATDLMISGDGFFVTRLGNDTLYTRAGAFDFDADGRLVSADGKIVQGYSAADGVVNDGGAIGDITLPLNGAAPATATTAANVAGNLPSETAVGSTLTRDTKVYDAFGTEKTLTLSFTRTAGGWNVVGTDGSGAGGNTTLAFQDGAQVGAGSMVVDGITVDLSKITGFAQLNTVAVTDQNGREAGTLQGFTLSKDGTLVGQFSNGESLALGRIALATFTNPGGLEKAGASGYRATANSGGAALGIPGSPGVGSLSSGTLEMSNVDLSQEFTNLIVAQRGFQANARIITTSDEVLQELTNLKR